MSNYPGENPQTPEDQQPADDSPQDTTEPTQPVGYWERQAAERAREQAQQQGHPDPTTPYPENPSAQNPYGQIPGLNPYGPYAPGAPQQPYAQQQYGQQQYGQPPPPGQPAPYPAPPGQPPYLAYAQPRPPDHPQSTLALVLGLVAVVGAFVLCGITLVVSPFAWAVGRNALKEIRASQGRLGGESNARAGMILGIIGSVLLILAIIAVIGFIILIAVGTTTDPGGSSV
jgi:hypothetical protein